MWLNGQLGLDDQLVLLGQPGQADAVVGVDLERVEVGAVEADAADVAVDEVGEGVRTGLAAGEAQRRGAGEHLVGDGEVEVDGVGRRVEQTGALSGLVAGQVRSRHGACLHHRARAPQNPGEVRAQNSSAMRYSPSDSTSWSVTSSLRLEPSAIS